MTTSSIPGLFITGTDTGVGKTHVTACIARSLRSAGHRVGVYKPVASGCERNGDELIAQDARVLWDAADRPMDLDQVCPQRFAAPLAPPLAAQAENRHVDIDLLRNGLDVWLRNSDFVLIEGAGGLMSPLSEEDYVADLAYDLGFPLLVVAPNVLGVINQTLQTLITATTFREGLDVAGIVLNELGHDAAEDPSVETNFQQLSQHCVPPVLARMPWQETEFDTPIDWTKVTRSRS